MIDPPLTKPETAVVPPGLSETGFTVKENDPVPLAFEKLKFCVGLEKTMVTPPWALVLTLPKRLATKMLEAPPLIPVGTVKVTVRSTTLLV